MSRGSRRAVTVAAIVCITAIGRHFHRDRRIDHPLTSSIMSADESSQNPRSTDPLQFDVAERAAEDRSADRQNAMELTCAQCEGPIVASYYEVNGVVVCARCRSALDSIGEGSRARRVLTAVGLGLLAAVGGSVIYFAIAALTGYEFGLVAIAVGFVVGKAVRRGSGGRGGWAYQTIAVVLTYFAIVSTYIPLAVREFRANPAQADSLRTAIAKRDGVSAVDSLDDFDDDSTAADTASTARSDSGFTVAQSGTSKAGLPHRSSTLRRGKAVKIGAGTVILGILGLLVFAAIIPILAGFSNIIGLVIIGIAVFEAWKLNKRLVLQITGPYRVSRGEEGLAASG